MKNSAPRLAAVYATETEVVTTIAGGAMALAAASTAGPDHVGKLSTGSLRCGEMAEGLG